MKLVEPAKPHRKSGVWGTRDLLVDTQKAIEGLRPSFSSHVRFGERGAPVQFPPDLFGI
jgi:hypothetical protein